MKNRNILILGGARFHGLQLAEHLVSTGNRVFVLNRGRYKSQYDSRIKHIVADRNNIDSLKRIFDDYEFEAVIDNNAYKPYQVETILRALRNRCKHYIFTSSVAVYQRISSDYKVAEEESTGISGNPYYSKIKEYAINKFQAENILRQDHHSINYTIIRIPTVFGEGDFLGKLIYLYERLKDGGKILLEEDIDKFSLIYVQDVVKIFSAVIENETCFGKTINVADPKTYDYGEFFSNIYGNLFSNDRVVLMSAVEMWEAGYSFYFVWGPMVDTRLCESIFPDIVYTPISTWGKRTLKWELENLMGKIDNPEFSRTVDMELLIKDEGRLPK